ncbi:hypothetical protein HPP92_026424 [Vanilla planifolia]|uniref:RRM domain-containing protein n=1 Tax=Vanilla planifolia TaxID=51239 RepID=A0A835PEF5_VANPL|nr:hypothetical protein HPP92_026424 [Vanilla planifolia]
MKWTIMLSSAGNDSASCSSAGPVLLQIREVQVNRVRPRSEKRTYQSHHSGRVGVAKKDTNSIINHGNNTASRKIFVGGLSANVTEDEFRRYFEQFGCITDVVIMHDNVSHRPEALDLLLLIQRNL